MASEDFSNKSGAVGVESGGESGYGIVGGGSDVRLERGPIVEAVFARDDVKSVGEFRLGSDVERGEASGGVGMIGGGVAEKRTGLVFEMVEIGTIRKLTNRHDSLLWQPVVRFIGQGESGTAERRKQRWDNPFPRTGCTLFCAGEE